MDALPPSDAARFRELERRIEVLERSNKLLASSIKGGTLSVLNSAGVRVAAIGELPADPGVYTGLRVYNSTGTLPILQVDQTNGFGIPWLSTAWREYLGSVSVTAGTFTNTYSTLTELLYSKQMLMRVGVNTAAGTTGEMRLYHVQTASVIGSTKTLPALSSALYEFRYTHGLTIGTGPHEFYLQIQRTGGAGDVLVFEPGPLHHGTNMGTVAGGWV